MIMAKNIKEAVNTEIVIASIEKQAAGYLKQLTAITSIKTSEEFDDAGQKLKALKKVAASAKEEQDKMIAPLKQAEEQIKIHFTPFANKVKALDATIKALMEDYLLDQKKAIAAIDKQLEEGKIKKVSTYVSKVAALQISSESAVKVRKVWTAVIEDENKIPKQYLVPDMKAITEALKAGKKVAGVEWKQVDNLSI
jgi:hypothetical protein